MTAETSSIVSGAGKASLIGWPPSSKPQKERCCASLAPIRASVTDAVEELLDELPRAGRMTFRELTGSLVERLEIVVRFLAVLEMYKQGLVELDQFTNFGDISITWIGGDPNNSEEGAWMRAMADMDSYDG